MHTSKVKSRKRKNAAYCPKLKRTIPQEERDWTFQWIDIYLFPPEKAANFKLFSFTHVSISVEKIDTS